MAQLTVNRVKHQGREPDDVLIQAVDEALMELGESVREAVYFEVARNRGIAKEEIARKFYEFISALRSEFGVGSKTIEALILEKLFGKIGSGDEFQKAAAMMIQLSSEAKHSTEEKPR